MRTASQKALPVCNSHAQITGAGVDALRRKGRMFGAICFNLDGRDIARSRHIHKDECAKQETVELFTGVLVVAVAVLRFLPSNISCPKRTNFSTFCFLKLPEEFLEVQTF